MASQDVFPAAPRSIDASDVLRIGGVVLSRTRPLDGAMGTELRERFGARLEEIVRWHVSHPEDVAAVYCGYQEVDAQVLTTNTLLAAAEPDGVELVRSSVELARRTCPEAVVFLSIAPGGDPGRAVELARTGAEAGATVILVETATHLSALCETLRVLRDARIGVPLIGSLVPSPDGRATFGCGTHPQDCVAQMIDAGAEAIGANCAEPPVLFRFIEQLAEAAPSEFPLVARPSAGIPASNAVSWSYPWTPLLWSDYAFAAVTALPNLLIGGCCGAGPRHIAATAAGLNRPSS